jgi:hypothetical protein
MQKQRRGKQRRRAAEMDKENEFSKVVRIYWKIYDKDHKDCNEKWLTPENIGLILNQFFNSEKNWIDFIVSEIQEQGELPPVSNTEIKTVLKDILWKSDYRSYFASYEQGDEDLQFFWENCDKVMILATINCMLKDFEISPEELLSALKFPVKEIIGDLLTKVKVGNPFVPIIKDEDIAPEGRPSFVVRNPISLLNVVDQMWKNENKQQGQLRRNTKFKGKKGPYGKVGKSRGFKK